jgi:hypothetical protein
MANAVTRIKGVFKFAVDNHLIDRPVLFGSEFKKPDKKVLRLHKAKVGVRLIEPADLHKLIAAADPVMRAMIYLGVNCGYGNTDVAVLPRSALDLAGGFADFTPPPRPASSGGVRCGRRR